MDDIPNYPAEPDYTTILIADDSPTALKVTSSVLKKHGYEVIQVTDGEQAIVETFNQKPSAVVVDLKMPKKDGYEVCRTIKKDKRFFFPLLLLTAREDIESLVKGLDSGADDYLIKPFNEMEFIARIRVLLRLKKLNDDLLRLNNKLSYYSTHDELTNLYNHRYFFSVLDRLIKQSKTEKSNLCLAIFDLDHFKNINDNFGHLQGDQTLKKVSKLLASLLPSDVILARYGGEEFTALFPNRTIDSAIRSCKKIIEECRKLRFEYGGHPYNITLSGGVTSTQEILSYNADDLIQAADKLLYQSKNTGRNKLSFHKIGK